MLELLIRRGTWMLSCVAADGRYRSWRGWVGIWLLLAGGCAAAHELPDADARYLGNEGVMVAAAGHKVLLDAFYSQSFATYSLVPDHLMADLIAGRAPYQNVDAVFISHVHGDHFSVAPLLAYLEAQPDVRVFCPTQVRDALVATSVSADLLARIEDFDLAPGERAGTVRYGGLDIDVAALPHAGGERMADVQNLVYRVALDASHTLVHLGDAAAESEGFVSLGSFWSERDVDSAFVPYWFFADDNSRALLDQFVDAVSTIGVHVPAAAQQQRQEWLERLGADLFVTPGESRRLVHQHR